MQFRFDIGSKMMGALLVALLVIALAVPACMTLACADLGAMSHNDFAPMSLSECLTSGIAHDALVTSGASTASFVIALAALLGLALLVRVVPPLLRAELVSGFRAAIPPPPLDPQGERLLI